LVFKHIFLKEDLFIVAILFIKIWSHQLSQLLNQTFIFWVGVGREIALKKIDKLPFQGALDY